MSLTSWIAPSRTALLLVDMQVDFAAPEGAMESKGRPSDGSITGRVSPMRAGTQRLATKFW